MAYSPLDSNTRSKNAATNPTTPHVINMQDTYRTVAGLAVRVLITDAKNAIFPVVALVGEGDKEQVYSFTKHGKYWEKGESDHRNLVLVSQASQHVHNISAFFEKPPADTPPATIMGTPEIKPQSPPSVKKPAIKITYSSDMPTSSALDLATSFLRICEDGACATVTREGTCVDIIWEITRVSAGKFTEHITHVDKTRGVQVG